MPAIARFVSFDGVVAFSERVMKLQKRDQEAIMIPLDDVVSVRVRRPQEDSDGFIRIETADGKRYRIFFEDDQLQEAVQFKRCFEDTVSDGEDETTAPLPEKAVSPRPERQSRYEGNARPARANPGSAPRKPIFKRWWFWVACAVLVIGIVGIIAGGPGKKDDTAAGAGAKVSQSGASGDGQSAPGQTGGAVDVGDYAVEIKDAFLATDYEGKPALVVTYTWTNNSSETTSAMVALLEKAFQDGIELEHATMGDVEGYDGEAEWKDIRPGVSLDVDMAFSLRSESDVEVEVSNWLNTYDPAVKTFSLGSP